MFFKVLKDGKVIDVLDRIVYLKMDPKHKTMMLSSADEAQAILSSDQNSIWHEKTLYRIPFYEQCFDTVELIEIDEHEYRQLKVFSCRSLHDVLDEYTMLLIDEGVI